jgi:hypothetical protein
MADVTITNVVTALAPAFAAGFAVQQGLQILDGFINLDKKVGPVTKTGLAGLVSLLLGIVFATQGIHVLSGLSTTKYPDWVDTIVSALVISGGTEGFNSIMKFLGYKKDAENPDKAPKQSAGPNVVNQAA